MFAKLGLTSRKQRQTTRLKTDSRTARNLLLSAGLVKGTKSASRDRDAFDLLFDPWPANKQPQLQGCARSPLARGDGGTGHRLRRASVPPPPSNAPVTPASPAVRGGRGGGAGGGVGRASPHPSAAVRRVLTRRHQLAVQVPLGRAVRPKVAPIVLLAFAGPYLPGDRMAAVHARERRAPLHALAGLAEPQQGDDGRVDDGLPLLLRVLVRLRQPRQRPLVKATVVVQQNIAPAGDIPDAARGARPYWAPARARAGCSRP
jgi:hypothetical protein